MTKRNFGHGLLNLLPALLFAVLAACVLVVLLNGVQIYSEMTRQNQHSYVNRTVRQYVYTKIRQAEHPAAVSVEKFGEETALIIEQKLDGQLFVEYIYCFDNYLRELFTFADSEMAPEDGEILLELSSFSPWIENGLLTIQLTDSSNYTQTIYLDLSEEVYNAK